MTVWVVFWRKVDGARMQYAFDYTPGQQVRHYLRSPTVRRYGLIHVGARSKIMTQSRRRLKLNSVVEEGESIYLVPVR